MNDLAVWVVEQKLITAEQLARARELQRQTGVPLAMALIELNLLEEQTIVELVAARHGLPKAPRHLHKLTVPPKALSVVPQDYCWQYNVFPFGIDPVSRRLQLAIVDPSDGEAVESLRKIARVELSLFVAGPRQVEKGIRRHYLDSLVDETNAPVKRLRYFGYDNITNPGVEAVRRPASEPPAAPAAKDLSSDLEPSAAPPEPVAAAPSPAKQETDLTWDAANPELAESTTGDLPVLKAMPTVPSRQVGRIQPPDPLAEALQRLDRLERLLGVLLDLLESSAETNLSSIAALRDSLRSR